LKTKQQEYYFEDPDKDPDYLDGKYYILLSAHISGMYQRYDWLVVGISRNRGSDRFFTITTYVPHHYLLFEWFFRF